LSENNPFGVIPTRLLTSDLIITSADILLPVFVRFIVAVSLTHVTALLVRVDRSDCNVSISPSAVVTLVVTNHRSV